MMLKDNGDGTISDSCTGLMWQQAENAEEMNYEDAVAFCKNLILAGNSDWRLPTKEELVALAQIGDEPLRTFFLELQQERYWAFTRRSELGWAESPDRIAYTVDFDPDSGNYCRPTTYFRVYKYFVRGVRTGGKSQPIKSEVVSSNEALRTLRARVERLGIDHPRQQRPDLDPQLDMQLPWIARTLEEAATALESGRDPFGNPITDAQVISGLRKLVQMVCDNRFLSAMDLGHPGIHTALQRCMAELEVIIHGIEGHPPAASPPPASKGVKTLISLCTKMGILFPNQYVNQAVEELMQEGEPGSRALALLIRELMECRSPKITHALAAAGRIAPTPELVDAVRAVAEAPELTEAPDHPSFTPEITGGGRVGWTSGTHRKVVGKALQAEELLKGHE
ncbi:hypothetical protein ADN00_17990 [Ornatilinea apprima]|uniref:Lcl C-terminal domain-containing protein n=1 Tax=Ornatilinea apprima TaxID=1134406 RepID=A0A0P6XI36_9CHLR|nr:DUF1566 domain-containing protein [Ornatilinea apprima]KPL70767.1 hypothetical protein ADN00_17990 [Ornatilinea apprima]